MLRAGREQVDGVAVALGFEELPDRADFHESRGFVLHFFHFMEQLQRFRIALRQRFSKLPLNPRCRPYSMNGIDVAPHLRADAERRARVRSRYGAGGIGMIGRAPWDCALRRTERRMTRGPAPSTGTSRKMCCAAPASRSAGSINSFISRKPGHGVFRVERRRAVAGAIFVFVNFSESAAPPTSSGTSMPASLQIAGRDHHLLRALHQQAGEPDGVGLVFAKGLDQLIRRNFNAEIHHVVAVVAENDLDQVLADIVHVALDGGEHDLAARRACRPSP